jgi:hypothetical protein
MPFEWVICYNSKNETFPIKINSHSFVGGSFTDAVHYGYGC